MFEIKWSKFARGWDDTPPHLDNAANSADMAAELS